jgi:hypothetical protein
MRQGKAACIIGNDVSAALNSGRILGAAELEKLFAEFSSSGEAEKARSDAEEREDEGEIPDLRARDELEAFVSRHEFERWLDVGGGVAEGAFNDTFAYWRNMEE